MGLSLKTHKMLWGRAGNRCSYPDCNKELVIDETETDDASIVGEECHIVAQGKTGPRCDENFSKESKDKYNNLILMCNIHHKLIDDQPEKHTVDYLKKLKEDHEKWVSESLDCYDAAKQRDDELYAHIIEQWSMLVDIDNWKAWSSYIHGSGQPRMYVELESNLTKAKDFLFSRIWLKRYPDLECSFENFRRVLQDFLKFFHSESEQHGIMFSTRKFYKIRDWDHKKYHSLLNEYNVHVSIIEDLHAELTRAAQLVCEKVRKNIDKSYRLKEGLLIIEAGPFMDLSYRQYRVEYSKEEKKIDIPYPGIDQFMSVRFTRDLCCAPKEDK